MTWMCWLFLALGPQSDALEKVVYAAGYIPNVQFAPFYVAEARGYYRAAGIDLEMDYTIGPDVFKLTALNKVQIASADPDAFMVAASKGMPLIHVATMYQRYPIALIAKRDILHSEDLRGQRIGISGTYGSSYLGLKAILADMGLGVEDVRVAAIGFTQVPALQQDRVDAVVGYINNEPVRLESLGVDTYTRTLPEDGRIPGVGLMVNKDYLAANQALVTAFLEATFRGMQDVLDDPKACYALVVEQVLPQLKDRGRFDAEYQILLATLPFWQAAITARQGFGQAAAKDWQNLIELLRAEPGAPPYNAWRDWVDFSFTTKPKANR